MKFDKCILCLKALDDSTPPEHVIPDFLGGRLNHQLLCAECNHGIGSKLYSSIKFDSWVRQAAWKLKDDLPKIFDSIEKRQKYTTQSPIGTVLQAERTNSGIHIRPITDSSEAVLPTVHAVSFMEKKLVQEHGLNSETAKTLASKINETPNGKKVQIYKGLSIVRWDGDKFKPDFTKNTIAEPNAMVLIAYEYLALLLGRAIYDDAFNGIRNSILNGQNLIKVELLLSPKPQAFHLIYPEFEKDRTVISIHLFEYSIAKVIFNKLKISNSPDFCYLEDLKKRISLGAMSVAEAKANQWREFDN